MAASFDERVCVAVKESLKTKSFTIKEQQLEAITNIYNGFDTLCILPTGFGKSLIYQLIPIVFKKLFLSQQQPQHHPQQFCLTSNPVVIVISQLLSLIKDQIDSANKAELGLKAVSLDSKHEKIST